jgi:DNA-binding MarR family transcriptional regulator
MKFESLVTRYRIERIEELLPELVAMLRPKYPRDPITDKRITVEQIYVLEQLDPVNPITVSGLAAKLGVSVPAASMAVSRLVARGYVEKRVDPEDRRRRLLRITPLGSVARRAHIIPDAVMVKRALDRIFPRERNLSVRGLTHLWRGAVMGRGIKDPWPPDAPQRGDPWLTRLSTTGTLARARGCL